MASGTDDLLTTSDVAERLEVSEVLVRRYCREGRFGTLVGDRWLITPGELREFKKNRKPRGRPRHND